MNPPARILLVDNVSVQPFRLVPPPFPASLVDDIPSRGWASAMQGEVDLAVVSLAKCDQVSATMEPLGDFGVASRGAVGSVLLFGERPLHELIRRRSPIHLSSHSETSTRLFRLLCREEFGEEPVRTDELRSASARLCIGDEALRLRLVPGGWPVVADLGEWWHRRTGLPFVFARWMVRRSASAAFRQAARQWLNDGVDAAATQAGRDIMAAHVLKAGLFDRDADARSYFDGLRSRFDGEDLRGERLFTRRLLELREA